jgi:hypothetical protein
MKRVNRFGVVERDPVLIFPDLIQWDKVWNMLEKEFDDGLKKPQPA